MLQARREFRAALRRIAKKSRNSGKKCCSSGGLKFYRLSAIYWLMTNNIAEFSRFTYLDQNFHDLREYCEDKGIWICQSLRRKGPLTFALARNDDVASDLSNRFS